MGLHSTRGFVALVSAIIIASILLSLSLVAGSAALYARFDSLANEEKKISASLAESCAQHALLILAIARDPVQVAISTTTITIGIDSFGRSMQCSIVSLTHPAHDRVLIRTIATWHQSVSGIEVEANIYDTAVAPVAPGHANIEILSWQEDL